MHRLNHAIHTTCACLTLGFAGTAFAATGIPTLNESRAETFADREAGHLQSIAPSLVRDAREEVRFRHFADLFLIPDEDQPAAGLAANVTAAVFGEGERRPANMVFGGGPPFGALMGGGGGEMFVRGGSLTNGPVNGWTPRGGGGIGSGGGGAPSGGGDGGTGTTAAANENGAGDGDSTDNGANNGNGNNGNNIVAFSDNPPAGNDGGNGHDGGCCCCCCCPEFSWGVKDAGNGQPGDPPGGTLSDGSRDGHTAAIPLPAPIWLGLMGLAAVGWMRRRSIAR